MACVLCLEEGGRSVCQCGVMAHLPCLAALMLRGYERCIVCRARLESRAVVLAARLTVNDASFALGPEHAKVQWRKLHLASAYVAAGDYAEAKRVLVSVSETASGRTGSLFLACQVDLARAMIKLGEMREAKHTLERVNVCLESNLHLLADPYKRRTILRGKTSHDDLQGNQG